MFEHFLVLILSPEIRLVECPYGFHISSALALDTSVVAPLATGLVSLYLEILLCDTTLRPALVCSSSCITHKHHSCPSCCLNLPTLPLTTCSSRPHGLHGAVGQPDFPTALPLCSLHTLPVTARNGAGSDMMTAPAYSHHTDTSEAKAGSALPSNKRPILIKLLGRKKSILALWKLSQN